MKRVCCFCGNSLKLRDGLIITIALGRDFDEFQDLFTHKKCLLERLHDSIPLYLDDLDENESENENGGNRNY